MEEKNLYTHKSDHRIENFVRRDIFRVAFFTCYVAENDWSSPIHFSHWFARIRHRYGRMRLIWKARLSEGHSCMDPVCRPGVTQTHRPQSLKILQVNIMLTKAPQNASKFKSKHKILVGRTKSSIV